MLGACVKYMREYLGVDSINFVTTAEGIGCNVNALEYAFKGQSFRFGPSTNLRFVSDFLRQREKFGWHPRKAICDPDPKYTPPSDPVILTRHFRVWYEFARSFTGLRFRPADICHAMMVGRVEPKVKAMADMLLHDSFPVLASEVKHYQAYLKSRSGCWLAHSDAVVPLDEPLIRSPSIRMAASAPETSPPRRLSRLSTGSSRSLQPKLTNVGSVALITKTLKPQLAVNGGEKYGFGVFLNKKSLKKESMTLAQFADAIYFVALVQAPSSIINLSDPVTTLYEGLGGDAHTFCITFPTVFTKENAEHICSAIINSLLKKHGKQRLPVKPVSLLFVIHSMV